ncbi:MAG: glycoside hydrolase family 15 protein [Candidatus Sericytochromatia bacterium]|nr:glycoside hydrolase family 15 protein [Candidatus Tanganyikabacteria bacterium]
MPRDLPIGNGRLLVNFDRHYRVRDLYFPHVGRENQTSGNACRFGVWTEGRLAWIEDAWEIAMGYQPDALVTDVVATHPDLELTLRCADAVDIDTDVLMRKVVVCNSAPRDREVRVFFHHDLNLYDNTTGDTAAYYPAPRVVTHYKDRRYVLIYGKVGTEAGIHHWAIGKKGDGSAGTWVDAEDGDLGGNPIAQGWVDSTVGFRVRVPAGGEAAVYCWLGVGRDYFETRDMVLSLGADPEAVLTRTRAYWQLWSNRRACDFAGLPPGVERLYKISLMVAHSQINHNGAVIAANDADIVEFNHDTYSYMWTRDGALVANAFDMAGYSHLTRRFFDLCGKLIHERGCFLHKYNPDGSLASSWHPWLLDGEPVLPIQEDETALVLWALWEHFERFKDIEWTRALYEPLIRHAGNFLADWRDARGLPLPSYDLWEERRGVLAWTVASVAAGLKAAANFAAAFGDVAAAARFTQAGREVREAMAAHLYRPELGRFARSIEFGPDGAARVDATLDASLCGVWLFGAFSEDDPRVVETMAQVRDRLWCRTEVGGVARYENDYYHQVSQDVANVPGNPWFICTMWLGMYEVARATCRDDLARAVPLLQWVVERALPSGILAEQVHPYTDEPLSVSPLTWSHATFVAFVQHYLEKLESLETCEACGNPVYRKQTHVHGELRRLVGSAFEPERA